VGSKSEEDHAADEAAFREANEQIRQAQRELKPDAERVPFLCECEERSCREPILLPPAEYELIRSESTHFVIVSGHPTDGDVVSERDGHAVVRKSGRGGDIAIETDPRKEDA